MSDLISRKALLEDFGQTITEQSDVFDWLNLINCQPVAYDVDNVVEQLDALMPVRIKTSYPNNLYVNKNKVIEIVKGGLEE